MNELTITNFNGVEAIDSRQVAEAIDKDHAHLMRDIAKYCGYLNKSKIGLVDFFIESNYKDGKGEIRPCYLCTRKGCEMIANKMTGQKGTVFTALYINAFHEMEKQLDSYMIDDRVARAKRWIEEQEKLKELQTTVKAQQEEISVMQPKATYYDMILKSQTAIKVTIIAKDYGESAQWLNKKLAEKGVQYKQGKTWFLYQQYAGCGYTVTKTSDHKGKTGEVETDVHMYWTQKGRKFIYDLLKEDGILPLIERENLPTITVKVNKNRTNPKVLQAYSQKH